jgi:hypothetical protein
VIFIFGPVSWVLFLAFRTALILLGWVLIPIAAAAKAYTSHYDKEKEAKNEHPWVYHWTWKIMRAYENPEDGIANQMYYKAPNRFLQIIYWSCFRNPTNGLRTMPYLSVKIDPDKVKWIGTDKPATEFDDNHVKVAEWFFAWHGLYSCIWVQFEMFGSIWRFWIGWKVFPYDTIGVTGHRLKYGAGFATQFKRLT